MCGCDKYANKSKGRYLIKIRAICHSCSSDTINSLQATVITDMIASHIASVDSISTSTYHAHPLHSAMCLPVHSHTFPCILIWFVIAILTSRCSSSCRLPIYRSHILFLVKSENLLLLCVYILLSCFGCSLFIHFLSIIPSSFYTNHTI